MLRPRAAALGLALLATLALTGAPATAATPSPAPSPAASPGTDVAAAARELLDAQRSTAEAAAAAGAALERAQAAQRAADAAALQARREQWAAAAADAAVSDARARLAAWAAQLYRTGAADARLALATSLLQADDPQALLSGLSTVRRVTGSQDDALRRLRSAAVLQEVARAASSEAAVRASRAAREAAAQRRLADAVVVESARRLGRAQAGLAAAQQAVEQARQEQQQALAAAAAARSTTASCTGADLTGAANGALPLSALCPLPGAAGQRLRADAAAAFAGLTTAFRQRFAVPLCVTDSYRDYASQVALRAAKPTLAAVPGTSNHGWGVALDLCGGVQAFDSAEHVWLQQNAAAFGWFQPAWAQAGGSKPEAWHWEYAG